MNFLNILFLGNILCLLIFRFVECFFFFDVSYVCELIVCVLKWKICGIIVFIDIFLYCFDVRRRVYMNYYIFFKFVIFFRRVLDIRFSLILEIFVKFFE